MNLEPETISSENVNLTEYYYLETNAGEWLWVLNRLIKRHTVEAAPDDAMIAYSPEKTTILLRKSRFSAVEIAKAIGATPEAVEKAPKIILKPLDTPDKFPAPTVDYVGVA